MADYLDTEQIKRRSVAGAKWLVLANLIGLPVTYLTTVVLARVSPSALGAYALAQIFIGVLLSFAMFGGPPVLQSFLPKIPAAELRGRFLCTYGMILAAVMAVVLGLLFSTPPFLRFLLRREVGGGDGLRLIVLSVIVIGAECLMAAAAGLMKVHLAALSRLAVRVTLLPTVAICFVLDRAFLLEHTTEIILVAFFAAYAFGAVLSAVGIARDARFRFSAGWHLPQGFWAFALTSTAGFLLSFLYVNFDRMCILGLKDLHGLGMYQAVLSLMMLIEYIPNQMQAAVVPMFSSLLASSREGALRRAYALVYRNSVLAMTTVALVLIGFSREALSIFGEEYPSYSYLLCLFAVVNVVRAPALANMGILVSHEANRPRLAISLLQILIQVGGTFWLMGEYGVLAIAGAKAAGVLLATTLGNLYVIFRLRMAPRVPPVFQAAVGVALAAFVLRVWIVPPGWGPALALTVGSLLAFALLSGVDSAELRAMVRLLTTGNGSLPEASGVQQASLPKKAA